MARLDCLFELACLNESSDQSLAGDTVILLNLDSWVFVNDSPAFQTGPQDIQQA
jgi:hypothetical protein